ncbi:hypothetical protein ACM736_28260 [Pseudomonas aeruginosa]
MTDINRLKVLAERAEALYGAPSLEHVFAITKFREAVEPKAILGLIAEVERLESEIDQCASALPGTYYMDPPDGGNVSIPEQIRRMAKDAARYRALRQKERGDVIVRDRVSHLIGEHLDAAIDAAEIGKSMGGGE